MWKDHLSQGPCCCPTIQNDIQRTFHHLGRTSDPRTILLSKYLSSSSSLLLFAVNFCSGMSSQCKVHLVKSLKIFFQFNYYMT